jgi:hypothetical protein
MRRSRYVFLVRNMKTQSNDRSRRQPTPTSENAAPSSKPVSVRGQEGIVSRCTPKRKPSSTRIVVGRERLTWRADNNQLWLYRGRKRMPHACVEPDTVHPGLFRVRFSGGNVSDIVNLTRAKDAALAIVLRCLNSVAQDSPPGELQARQKSAGVSDHPRSLEGTPNPRSSEV